MIPVAGSAYTYSYANHGRIGRLDHRMGPHPRIRRCGIDRLNRWSEYANRVLEWFSLRIPYKWSHSPFGTRPCRGPRHEECSAVCIFASAYAACLSAATKESAFVNGLIVILKTTIVLLFIGIGWQFSIPANHTP